MTGRPSAFYRSIFCISTSWWRWLASSKSTRTSSATLIQNSASMTGPSWLTCTTLRRLSLAKASPRYSLRMWTQSGHTSRLMWKSSTTSTRSRSRASYSTSGRVSSFLRRSTTLQYWIWWFRTSSVSRSSSLALRREFCKGSTCSRTSRVSMALRWSWGQSSLLLLLAKLLWWSSWSNSSMWRPKISPTSRILNWGWRQSPYRRPWKDLCHNSNERICLDMTIIDYVFIRYIY